MNSSDSKKPFRRRVRYKGTHPQRFEHKYKELDPERDPETIAKVLASGKTPAGQHRPVLVAEVLEHLSPQPGERGADVTLGYGGHGEALLQRLRPGGRLLGLDVDSAQLPRTEARLRGLGYDEQTLVVRRYNYAGLVAMLTEIGWDDGVDVLIADLGLSSMQIDNPARGFSYKQDGPLDMRMNPDGRAPAKDWLARCKTDKLARVLVEGSDEPHAERVAEAIVAAAAEAPIETTKRLRRVIESALPRHLDEDRRSASVTRVFQAIRIAVNDEFSALDAFLASLPRCLRPGGRVAIISFHSGEDRRVKHHFREGSRNGVYCKIAPDIIRPSVGEIGGNPRAASAKLRWAIRGRRLVTALSVCLLTAAVVLVSACSSEGVSRPVPPVRRVILVTIDTLRADHLSTYGYPIDTAPFLESLASDSVVFTRAFAHSATTRPSHTSMFTALYPLQHQVQNNGDVLDESFLTLAEVLRDRGLRTAGFVSSAAVYDRSNLGQGLEIFDGQTRRSQIVGHLYQPADETTAKVEAWLGSDAAQGEFFLWVHYYDPHQPHQAPQQYVDEVVPRSDDERQEHAEFLETQHRLVVSTETELDRILQYDAEIRFVDAELERLYRALDERGLNEDALWVITSDHGQGLGNHDWFGHHKNIYNEQLRVPLVFHFPGHSRPDRIEEIVEQVDIPVTLAELVGSELAPQTAPIQGRSLVSLLQGDARTRHREYAFGERRRSDIVTRLNEEPGERYSLQNHEYKYVWFSEGPDEFYRLVDDPYETRDLIDESRPSEQRMRDVLVDLVATLQTEGEAETVSDEVRERLKSLGYVD